MPFEAWYKDIVLGEPHIYVGMYCESGWIICNKYNLPKEKGKYQVTYFWSNKGCVELCDFEDGKFYPSSVNHENVYAWKPCDFPKPYCEDEPKYEYES